MRRVLVLLTALSLAGALAAPAAALAASAASLAAPANVYLGHTVSVAGPNGTDDTANIQAALDWCSKHSGPGCTVQLQKGTYKIQQLVGTGFSGTFRGMGMGVTTLSALPDLKVNAPDLGGTTCLPTEVSIGTCLWPVVLNFVDGTFEISDLSLDIPAKNSDETETYTLGGYSTIGIFAAINLIDYTHQDAVLDRVSVSGRNDDTAPNMPGFNTVYGINQFVWAPTGTSSATGSFTLRDSSVRTVAVAVSPGPEFNALRVTIKGNTLSGVFKGIMSGEGPSGVFEISHNRIGADNLDTTERDHYGIFIAPTGLETGVASRFSIHDNVITVADTCGCSMFGIVLLGAVWGAPNWFTATVVNNAISLTSPGTLVMLPDNWKDGIQLNNTIGTMVIANTIAATSATGAGEAIGIFGQNAYWGVEGSPAAAQNVVVGNNVRGFAPQGTPIDSTYWPGLGTSQYYLDPNTTNNLVVCTRRSDTLVDWGTGNKQIGCDPSTATPKAAVGTPAPASRLRLTAKPLLP
jgi:hypothetical protein